MLLIVSGSRHITDYELFKLALADSGFSPTIIVHGNATGVDRLGKRYGEENNCEVLPFPADWTNDGKAAGPIRNSKMVKFADSHTASAALLALWDGKSRGTFDCIMKAHKAGLPVYVRCTPGLRKGTKNLEYY